MQPGKGAIERAFELARSGRFTSLGELKSAVSKEGYQADQLHGPSLGKQLREIMKSSVLAK